LHHTKFCLKTIAPPAISARTKAALAAAKTRGTKLGGLRPDGLGTEDQRAAGRLRSMEIRKKHAAARATDVKPIIAETKAKGLSLRGIATELDARGITTARGCRWTAAAVSRIER
jgi:DNA invertase Pin-like site-specific DNA recombinase